MAHLAQCSGLVGCCSAIRFHADQARLQLDEIHQHPGTPHLFAQGRLAKKIDTMHLEYCLCLIETACPERQFGRSFLVVDYSSTLSLQFRLRKEARILLKLLQFVSGRISSCTWLHFPSFAFFGVLAFLV